MQTWQSGFLGVGELLREISAFELEAFFTFSGVERPGNHRCPRRQCLAELVTLNEQRRPRSKSQIARERLIEGIRPVRGLLRDLVRQPWQASDEPPVIEAITVLRDFYERQTFVLPDGRCPDLGSVWRDAIAGLDRERAFRALEVGVLLGLRRALRNGSVWIAHGLNFCSRKQLFIPEERWAIEARRHYTRLSLPPTARQFLAPVLSRLTSGLQAVAAAANSGKLSIDDDLHLKALEAEDEDPEVVKLRAALLMNASVRRSCPS
jgi:hypothetical protein